VDELTVAQRQNLDRLRERVIDAFGIEALSDGAEWEVNAKGVAIRAGNWFYQLGTDGEDLVAMNNTDPSHPEFTVVHADGTRHENSATRKDAES
jgi:hypothetical protein